MILKMNLLSEKKCFKYFFTFFVAFHLICISNGSAEQIFSTNQIKSQIDSNESKESIENNIEKNIDTSKFALPAAAALPSDGLENSSKANARTSFIEKNVLNKTRAVIGPSTLDEIYRGSQTLAKETILPNGLKVLILENHEFPIVSTLMFYKVGSRYEEPGSTGISHMLEHLLFQEVGSFKTGEIASSIARLGGQFNGYTSDDFTSFFETLPASRLELSLKIESERMHQAHFTKESITQELANIVKEFEEEARDPQALLSREIRTLLFTHHPYHNATLGWRHDVESITPEQLQRYYEKYYCPNNATLVLSGDVNPKLAMNLIQKYFGAIPKNLQFQTSKSIIDPPSHSERRVQLKYSGNKEVLQVAYRAPSLEEADAPVMVVLEKLLNGGISGKLKSKLLETKLCSLANANYEMRKEPGYFSINCNIQNSIISNAQQNAQQRVLESIDSLLNSLKEKPILDSDLRRAKNQAEFAFYSECEGPYRAGFHLGYFDVLDKWQNSYTWNNRISAVTSADISRIVQKYFNSESRIIGHIIGNSAIKSAPNNDSKPVSLIPYSNLKVASYKPETSLDKSLAPKVSDRSKVKSAVLVQDKLKVKKAGIPAVIRDLPSAVGNVVTGNIPGAVSNVGEAIVNIPGAIGDIGNAVGATAQVIGKQISQLKPSSDITEGNIQKRVLKNGLTLVVFESHVSPIVQIVGSLRAGEAYSPKGKSGLSFLLESVLNQGSSKRSKNQMLSFQDDMGINPWHMLKFSSGQETIDFSARCLSRDLHKELELIAETLLNPVSDELLFDKAKQDSLANLRKMADNTQQKVQRVLLTSLLESNSVLSPSASVDRMKIISQSNFAEIQNFMLANVSPNNTTLILVGDIKMDEAAAMVEKCFQSWTVKPTKPVVHAKLRQHKILRSTIPLKDNRKSILCFAQLIPLAYSDPDYGSLLIADGVLANHPMLSRFESAISKNSVLENAINSGDFVVQLNPIANMTLWTMILNLEPTAVHVSTRVLKHELRQLSLEGARAEEFIEVKRYLLGLLPVKFCATLNTVSNKLLESLKHGDGNLELNAEISSIKAASLESVNRMIRNYFKPDTSTIVVAGGAQSIKAVRSQTK